MQVTLIQCKYKSLILLLSSFSIITHFQTYYYSEKSISAISVAKKLLKHFVGRREIYNDIF